jgi:hypothetical protein
LAIQPPDMNQTGRAFLRSSAPRIIALSIKCNRESL